MKQTNMLSTCCRLLGNYNGFCFGGKLYSKTIFILALFLLPSLIFAQNKQSEQEAIKVKQEQAYLDAKQAKTSEQLQVKQNTQISNAETADQQELEYLIHKFDAYSDKEKYLNAGFTEAQILEKLRQRMTDGNVRGGHTEYRVSGGEDLCNETFNLFCDGGLVEGDTFGATATGVPACAINAFGDNEGVWYKMEGNGESNTVTVASTNAAWDVVLYVLTGSCGTNGSGLGCLGGVTQGASSITWNAAFGDPYYVYVTSSGTEEGTYHIELTTVANCIPSGDGLSSSSALPIACGDTDSQNTADFLNTEVGPACGNTTGNRGVWYVFNADASYVAGTGVTIDLCDSGMDSEIHVYSTAALDCVINEDDDFTVCGGNDPSVNFDAQPGVDYYIYVSHWSGGSNTTGAYDITVACDGIAPPPPPIVPANDECPDATEITCNNGVDYTIFDSTILATDTDEPPTCDNSWNGVGVWYFIDGDGSTYDLTTCGYDTVISVYEGACNAFTCVTSNDSSSFLSGCTSRANVNFTTDENTTYYVYVSSWSSTFQSDFELRVSCSPPPEPPANDACTDAEPILCGATVTGNTILATAEVGLPFCDSDAATNSPGVWYSYTGTGDIVDLNLVGTNYDAVISVYTGGCNGLTCLIGENGDFSDDSSVRLTSEVGTEYLIFVSGFEGATGFYSLDVVCQPDPCTIAVPIECGDELAGSTDIGFGSDVGPTADCAGFEPGTYSTFFVLEGTDELVTLETCDAATDFDTRLHVYQGSCGELVCVASDDDGCAGTTRSSVGFFAEDGESYYIQVSGWNTARGDFVLTATCAEPEANDTCEDAIALGCDSSIDGSTVLSTNRGNPAEDCSEDDVNFQEGVWYTVTGTGGEMTLSTCTADFDTLLLVYTGTCDGGFTCYAGSNDACGTSGEQSSVVMDTTENEVYYIYVTGNAGTFSGTEKGTFTLTVECACIPGEAENACATVYEGFDTDSAEETLTGEMLYGDGVISYSWSPFGQTTQAITVNASDGTQNYVVTMTDESGCSVTQSFYVRSIDVDCDRNNNNDKVEICHNGNSLCVSINAVQNHLNHGDTLGTCDVELCDEVAPECDLAISPADGDVEVTTTPTITWTAPTGIVTGYNVELRDDSNAVVEAADAGNTLSYVVTTELNLLSDYTVSVTPYNDNGSAINCGSNTFTTTAILENGLACDTGYYISCGESDSGSTVGAPDNYPTGNSCGSTFGTNAHGVWYIIEGTDEQVSVNMGGSNTDFDAYVRVFEGDDCDALTCVGFQDSNFTDVTFASNLGSNYYVYVSGWSNTGEGNYELNVTSCQPLPEAPANDDCGDAESLTVNADYDCDIVTAGSIQLATDSNLDNCGGTATDDVWYTFVAQADEHRVSLINVSGSTTDLYHAVYEADDCGSIGSALTCSDNNTSNTPGLTTGQTYYVQVYSWDDDLDETTVFDICVGTPPPPPPAPANDDPTGAIALTVSATCTNTLGTNVGATGTAMDNPDCTFYQGGDVWFTATTVSGTMTIIGDNSGGFTDGGMEVYTGTPGSLVFYECDDDDGPGLHSQITYNGTAGDTVYIRYWEYGNNSFGTFNICATDAAARQVADLEWNLYPNPSRGRVNLDLKDFINNDINVMVVDLTGAVILNKSVQSLQDPKLEIELKSVPSGMYFVRVTSNNTVSSKKLIITN